MNDSAVEAVLARSHLSRALGLAQSLESPLVKDSIPPGARAVASEIVLLLKAVLSYEQSQGNG